MAYNYDPAAVAEYGKDRMRFELGDTMVEGGPDTTALTDEEIEAALSAYPKSWKSSLRACSAGSLMRLTPRPVRLRSPCKPAQSSGRRCMKT